MSSLLRYCLLLAALSLAGTCYAEEPRTPSKTPTPGDEPAPRRIALDKLKLPPGGVIVIADEVKETLRLFARAVVLTPEKYQEMMDRIQQLERQLKPDRMTPRSCKLTGRVEGEFASLQADFKLVTEQPRGSVTLGCQGSYIIQADLDGQLPLLTYGEDGYVVQVEKAGEHNLTLQLKLPVTVRRLETLVGGAEHGFELGLPGAPMTSLTIDLPKSIKELRWNDVVEKNQPPVARNGTWELALDNKAKNLKVSWRQPVALPNAGSLLTATWDVGVKIQENYVLTTADLTLNDLRGRTSEWRIWAPAEAKLQLLAPEEEGYEITRPDANGPFMVKGPATERLQLQATVEQQRPFSRLPVGPFLVLGADRQEGTIKVRAAPEVLRGLRLVYHRQGEVRQQDIPRDQPASDLVAVFKYWNVPEPAKSQPTRPSKFFLQAPLELELKAVTALIETSVEHLLRVRSAEQGWQVVALTKIHATPLHNAVDFLDVQLPRLRPPTLPALAVLAAGGQTFFPQNVLDTALALHGDDLWPVQVPGEYVCVGEGLASSAELHPLPVQRKARIHLHRLQFKKFTVILSGTYLLPANTQKAHLELPRPVTLLDKGGKLRVESEDNLELLVSEDGATVAPERQQYTTTWDRAPVHADLAWRPYQPEVPATLLADVTLHSRHGHVREQLELQQPERQGVLLRQEARQARPLRLRVPDKVTGLKVVRGGTLVALDVAAGLAHLEAAVKEPLIVEYDFPLPRRDLADAPAKKTRAKGQAEESQLFAVPLLRPEEATRLTARVRVWSDAGSVPVVPEADLGSEVWRDQGTERVAGRDSLPALVLQGEGRNLALQLRLLDSALPPLASVLADRVLVQVVVDEGDARSYRVRFWLSKLKTTSLEVQFPVPLSRLRLQIMLDGDQLTFHPAGKVARLDINPALYTHPVMLDISYQLVADTLEPDGICQTALQPPILLGDVFVGWVRWQVLLPSSQVPLPPVGHASAEPRWTWHGWLLAPEPAVTGRELEHWLTGKEVGDDTSPSSLVFAGATLEPVTVVHVPQQAWLLICSGLLLVLGLGLTVAPLSRLWFWVALASLGVGVVAAGISWPALLPSVLYGCQPGAVVLAVLLGVQWLLHQRYRRQVVFMPAFTRLKTGSSLIRSGSRSRDTSTVDAPPSLPGVQVAGTAQEKEQ